MHDKLVALITGANQGIGLQIAKDLAAHDFTVLIGSRNIENGQAAAKSIGANAHAVQLDVTDAGSIQAAAERIRQEFGRLDVLVNNAGISHAAPPNTPFEQIIASNSLPTIALDDVRRVWETNVFGVIAVTQAMLTMHEAPAPRIVNIGSTAGSLTSNSDPANTHHAMLLFGNYSASKTALHAISLGFAQALEPSGIKVNIACPGYTSTALNSFQGTRSAEEGAREAVRLALLGPDGPTGTFSDEDGPVAW